MKKTLLVVFIFISSLLHAQNQTEIGVLRGNEAVITINPVVLSKAFEWMFRDGTKVADLKIEQLSGQYFLVAYCNFQQHKRMVAIDLEIIGQNLYISQDPFIKVCSAVACQTCKFFLENMRIIACKCEETGTISNHCHYRSIPGSGFVTNLNRAIMLNKERE
jgi:hypothetical protein